VTFNPASQEVAWYEDVQEVAFRFPASAGVGGRLLSGTIEACVKEGLPIARLGLSLRVRGDRPAEAAGEAPWVTGEAEMFRSVFASHAHMDGTVVRRCAAAYRALGIEMYIDRDTLLAGQAWHPAFLSIIGGADVFQLYWSETARISKEVEKEWRHALSLSARRASAFFAARSDAEAAGRASRHAFRFPGPDGAGREGTAARGGDEGGRAGRGGACARKIVAE
jgi:hypothetical protein